MKFCGVFFMLALFGTAQFANAQSTYTGKMLRVSLENVINQLNKITLGPNEFGTSGYTISYTFSANTTGITINYSRNDPNAPDSVSVSFKWQDLDASQIQESPNNPSSSGVTYSELDGQNKTGLSTIQDSQSGFNSVAGYIAASQSTVNNFSAPFLGTKTAVDHIADLFVTAIKLSQGAVFSGGMAAPKSFNGTILTETVEQNPLNDGTSIVNIRNNTAKSIYLTASTENCDNLEVTQCGSQLNHVRVGPKSTVHFWIDREDDTKSWSYTVSCIVNGSRSSDCATGGGGGPKS